MLNHLQAYVAVLIGLMMGAEAAQAQQPPSNSSAATSAPPVTAPAAVVTTTATPSSAAPKTVAATARPSLEVVKRARLAGYHVKKLERGATVFCKNEAQIGSRFSTETCIDETQLEEFLLRAQTQRDNLNNRRETGTTYH